VCDSVCVCVCLSVLWSVLHFVPQTPSLRGIDFFENKTDNECGHPAISTTHFHFISLILAKTAVIHHFISAFGVSTHRAHHCRPAKARLIFIAKHKLEDLNGLMRLIQQLTLAGASGLLLI